MNADFLSARDREFERTLMRRLRRANLVAGMGIACLMAASLPVLYVALRLTGGFAPNVYVAIAVLVAVELGCVFLSRSKRMVRSALRHGSETPSAHPETVAELTESRREIVAAFEIERRRIERDLHDGAQQYLVTASMDVGEASLLLENAVVDGRVVPERMEQVRLLLERAQDDSEAALRSLRTTVAGIHPKVLSDMGLKAAVENLCASSCLNVRLRVPHALPVIPEGVIAAGYFLVSEALTNVVKYAPHARVSVLLAADDDLHITVTDDGPGGAVIRPDGGLSGLRERLAAFGGRMRLVSPVGGPTSVVARIPLLLRHGEFGVGSVADIVDGDGAAPPETTRDGEDEGASRLRDFIEPSAG